MDPRRTHQPILALFPFLKGMLWKFCSLNFYTVFVKFHYDIFLTKMNKYGTENSYNYMAL